MAVDDIEVQDYVDHQGIRWPDGGVAQSNALQLTEVDSFDFAKNQKNKI
jgi:hypothetical protein